VCRCLPPAGGGGRKFHGTEITTDLSACTDGKRGGGVDKHCKWWQSHGITWSLVLEFPLLTLLNYMNYKCQAIAEDFVPEG
jgi:hypothetical protein